MTDGTNPVIEAMAEAFFRVSGQQIGRTDLSYGQLPEGAKNKVRECAQAALEAMPDEAPSSEDAIERAKRTIAEQGSDLTLEQVTAQRDLWIISASEWEMRLSRAQADVVGLREALREAESEARRFAAFYPEASDGRNSFVILADKIAALAKVSGVSNPLPDSPPRS
jgi:hypothetical protein